MGRQAELFPALPRRWQLKRMHVIDAGHGMGPGRYARFQCRRCGESSEWMPASMTDQRRGIACPKCNKGDNPDG